MRGQALELLLPMEQRGIIHDTIYYNGAISSCAKGLQWQKTLGLLALREKRCVVPGAVSYNVSTLTVSSMCCTAQSLNFYCVAQAFRRANAIWMNALLPHVLASSARLAYA